MFVCFSLALFWSVMEDSGRDGEGGRGGKKSYLSHILGNAQDPFADTTPGYHSKTPIFFCKDGLRLYSMNGFIHTCSIFFFGNRPYHKLV
jgi:hypothetical protein